MAHNNYFPLRGVNFHEPVLVAGSFAPDTNTTYPHAVSAATGSRFTVAKTAAGTYVVTLNDAQLQMVAAYSDSVGAVLTNGSSLLSVNCSVYNATNKTVTLTLVTNTGTVAEPSSVTGTTLAFMLLFKATASKN